MADKH